MFKQVFTITFGDRADNHANMEKLGSLSDRGFDLDDINVFKDHFEKKGLTTEFFDLKDLVKKVKYKKKGESNNNKNGDEMKTEKKEEEKEEDKNNDDDDDEELLNYNDAYLLIVRNGLSSICNANEFYEEQNKLEKDKKAFMYGRVVNKNARHNLCFTDGKSRGPDYEKGKGTIVSFNDCPLLKKAKETFEEILGDKAEGLVAEGNYYYEPSKCGIGWHGDAERRKVIGIRIGLRMNICFNWFLDSKPIGNKFVQILNHGDIYIMSEHTVGFNWKKKKIPTLRHSAGSSKFTLL
ncbi:hypothetical protein RB653_000823 [Dictyostelium firmibasis]|uniref:Alpha-ketoglutarate-dependent dioxygenase AlkB-like domain-containing protein n=1 Tax=Dictyostelium firmibasis TaxID=79012 RepID=A0AAN7TVV8_9MYCE